MAKTVYGEARSEHKTGRRAVAHVIANRLQDDSWPNESLIDVVRQPWQFSVWNPITVDTQPFSNYRKTKNVDENNTDFQEIKDICKKVLDGNDKDPTQGATHYHTVDVHWRYRDELLASGYVTKKIGSHVFYYRKDGSETATPETFAEVV